MKISVITPTFNSAKTIADNVKSVLSQDFDNFEHIIVDNLSTDHTIEIITELYSSAGKMKHLQVISESDKGISDAFNKGIKNASGDIINILNSDDEYLSGRLFSDIIAIFTETPETTFVHGDINFLDEKFGSSLRRPLLCKPEEAMPFNHPTMFVRADIYKNTGVFDVMNKYCMDYDLICRWFSLHPEIYQNGLYFTEYPMVKMSAGGVSWKYELAMLDEMYKIVEKYQLDTISAKRVFSKRKFRIKLKQKLDKFGLSGLVKVWRKRKWG